MSRPRVDKSSEWDFIKIILTKDWERSKRDKKRVRIRKSKYIELDRTHCYTGKFNAALSLCRVLGLTLYFSNDFSKTATRELAVTKVLQSLEVIIVCFLG